MLSSSGCSPWYLRWMSLQCASQQSSCTTWPGVFVSWSSEGTVWISTDDAKVLRRSWLYIGPRCRAFRRASEFWWERKTDHCRYCYRTSWNAVSADWCSLESRDLVVYRKTWKRCLLLACVSWISLWVEPQLVLLIGEALGMCWTWSLVFYKGVDWLQVEDTLMAQTIYSTISCTEQASMTL